MQNNTHFKGTLSIKPLSARLNKDLDSCGKMDPYCSITIQDQKKKSSVAEEMGKFPKWTDV